MAEKRKRGQNFTREEKEKLVKLLLQYKNTILDKKTDGSTNEAKAQAWNDLTTSFNASGSNFRTKESLIKVWEKLKSESKLYYTSSRKNATQTGGGPSLVKFDPLLEQVCVIMGRGCTGIEGVYDSDSMTGHLESQPKRMCILTESFPVAEENIEIQEINFTPAICFDTENITSATVETPSEVKSSYVDIAPSFCATTPSTSGLEDRKKNNHKTPMWSRRRPTVSSQNERSEAIGSISSGFKNVYKKKEDVEELKCALLKQEYESKKKLFELQIEATSKDLVIKELEIEIKKAVLEKIKGDMHSADLQYNNNI